MRSRFDRQLFSLNREIIEMGSLCEETIALASRALAAGSAAEYSAAAAQSAEEIARKERDIEQLCLSMLLQQQPVAGDLRQISSALRMIADIRRIGDQAVDIVEIAAYLGGEVENGGIHDQAEAAAKMVGASVEAFVKRDTALAESVVAADDVVDEAFLRVKRGLIELIAENPGEGERALDLLMIAKYFERIGDHAVSLAGWVLYSITGEREEETR